MSRPMTMTADQTAIELLAEALHKQHPGQQSFDEETCGFYDTQDAEAILAALPAGWTLTNRAHLEDALVRLHNESPPHGPDDAPCYVLDALRGDKP